MGPTQGEQQQQPVIGLKVNGRTEKEVQKG